MRNTVGWDFHPATGDLYFNDNSIDRLGDNAPGEVARLSSWGVPAQPAQAVSKHLIPLSLPPPADCELNRLALAGPFPQNFGHPFCYSWVTRADVCCAAAWRGSAAAAAKHPASADRPTAPRSMGVGPPSRRDPGSVPITSWVNNVDSKVLDCNGGCAGTRVPSASCRRALPAPPAALCRPRASWPPADPSQHVKAVQGIGPHHAPLGNRFYRAGPGAMFPQEYNNTLFIAVHGSLHRCAPRCTRWHPAAWRARRGEQTAKQGSLHAPSS
jgi:hypothetical protein